MSITPETLQAAFAAALRDPSPAAAPGVFDAIAARRFRIYRNNARVALIEALAANYPVVRRIAGDRRFAELAQAYVADRPSRDRTLNFYGGDFPAFVAGDAGASGLPYLADTARLERSVLEARHAADESPLDPTTVAALGDAVATAGLVPHPAMRFMRADYPVADMWNAHQGETDPGGDLVFSAGAAAALVVRPGHEVSVVALDAPTAAFVESLIAGSDLMTAHAVAAALGAEFDVLGAFRDLLAMGAFVGIAGKQPGGNDDA